MSRDGRDGRKHGKAVLTLLIAMVPNVCGCATGNARRLPVTVVVGGVLGGTADGRAALEAAVLAQPVAAAEMRIAAPAGLGTLTAPSAAASPGFGEVRKKYLAADSDGCLALLGDEGRWAKLLSDGDRSSTARLLFWRVACRIEGDQRSLAERDADVFASLGLTVPPDARDASPDVENAIDRAVQRAGNRAPTELTVTANAPRARIQLDGRDETCLAPCVVHAARGDHVVTATADGFLPSTTRVTLDGATRALAVSLMQASAGMAASQWRAHYQGGVEEQAADSVRLLSIAVPGRYLVLLTPETSASRTRLRGVLYFDAGVRARAERVVKDRNGSDAVVGVIDELLHESRLVESTSVLKSPLFWLGVAGTATLAAVLTYYVLRPADQRTDVRVR